MPAEPATLLARTLADPGVAAGLAMADWELLVRTGRQAGLLATLDVRLREAGLAAEVPAAVARHLLAASRYAAQQARATRDELTRVRGALSGIGIEPVLLKGCAYVAAGLPPAAGRLMADLDLMVARAELARAERALMLEGFVAPRMTPYDRRYYRRWMHELPPMRHHARGTTLDLHHNILPRTHRARPDAAALLAAARPLAEWPGLRVLAPADMVLHAVAHRFCDDGECGHALRDLWDLDRLLRHFAGEAGFAEALAERAERFGLARALYYALDAAERVFASPVPDGLRPALARHAPPAPVRWVMRAVLARVLRPAHPLCDDPLSAPARGLYYLRGHWLRMPPQLLVPHLARKAIARRSA